MSTRIVAGELYGSLRAIEPITTTRTRLIFWKFECACGRAVVRLAHTVASSPTSKCSRYCPAAPRRQLQLQLTYRGRTMSLRQWAQLRKIKYVVLYQRLHCLGWSVKKSLTTPVRRCRR